MEGIVGNIHRMGQGYYSLVGWGEDAAVWLGGMLQSGGVGKLQSGGGGGEAAVWWGGDAAVWWGGDAAVSWGGDAAVWWGGDAAVWWDGDAAVWWGGDAAQWPDKGLQCRKIVKETKSNTVPLLLDVKRKTTGE
ncbi:hypothetical protein OTU49_010772 [Cherax quadricarinatus]|uniref:Uncharacterized protein n=1 Tax=Cherax quadricarinatus TaxID=27406 RepID=A0AAW0WDB1_CHEQU